MKPFMYTFTDPPVACWASELLAANDLVYSIERPEDWTAPYLAFAASLARKQLPRKVELIAHPVTWALLGAVNVARAYRPEGVP